ncbi:DUF5079 family protein [Staphylococcus chromogenes]|uniref:DUF5079 family protein n=1 Tax=Staphylococcus chromogenes TaxID=46126 RepID=UPI000D1AB587|nr:DUF5079 family protein [Staphylococcus chromogenes]MCE5044122.1 DUF5079 family protein [Staphylococcus chromogenes]MDT0680476.1 DUF5079 family protein [Staphylococcus chromogenes]MDT0715735.1 DUF5079 family protein [Staphylococcus chromogenes]MDT0735943.1 DUF5079 family protein [Staphylococcus chromogenes]MDT0749310.1 DUF5079 family protein [Staphylococcus chromogenes]
MLETYITNLKKSHMKPFIIFIILFVLFFDAVILKLSNAWFDIPIYLYVIYAIWMIFNVILMFQDSYKNIQINKISALRYLIINNIAGYLQPIAMASIYLICIIKTPWHGLMYLYSIIGAVILSFLAILIFSLNEFHIVVKKARSSINIFAIILKLISLAWIGYLFWTVPTMAEENNFVGMSIIVILCIDLLILRSFFSYALFMDELRNGPYKMESHQSNVQ